MREARSLCRELPSHGPNGYIFRTPACCFHNLRTPACCDIYRVEFDEMYMQDKYLKWLLLSWLLHIWKREFSDKVGKLCRHFN